MEYKNTIITPKTAFPMKAGLPNREPGMLEAWNDMDLYGQLLEKNRDCPRFILHDGPPFSNGDIHMGHALNKTLKDFIVRARAMQGYYTPYVPGWDNHGMPIESAIIKKNKLNHKTMPVPEFRSACEQFAQDYIDRQMTGFRRLGVIGDWAHPYKTMDKAFEAEEVKIFGAMYRKGYIYKGLKPVYWCPKDETALAEAEIEYADDACTSIYVKFALNQDFGKLAPYGGVANTYVIIWTTTPWTLPDNMAVCLHPEFEYVLVQAGDAQYLLAAELLADCAARFGWANPAVLGRATGAELAGLKARHPFYDRESPLVLGKHVTLDAGTGCVHTAPGHGREDYEVGLAYGLDILSPLDDAGRFLPTVPFFAGLNVFEANPKVMEKLEEVGALLHKGRIKHSYPHCWRCKEPVIFRATTQWFISMEKNDLRARALKAIDEQVRWIPAWGRERIHNMVALRPDWCISRQRQWGVPILALLCEDCGEAWNDPQWMEGLCDRFAAHPTGCDYWYEADIKDIVPQGLTCPHCGGSHWKRETDILDVWFDSGTSFAAVLEQRPELAFPADLYLEGSDQHRGWFHSSLLVSEGNRGCPPYRSVLTHGYVVDGEGHKMSKSVGNIIAPQELTEKYGAEIVRLWASSVDYREDIRLSDEIVGRLVDAYRRIRNTCRFILGNLHDLTREDLLPVAGLLPLDRFALDTATRTHQRVQQAYMDFDFHKVYHCLHNYCVTDLSAVYLDILKDRLYASSRTGVERRSAQTALWHILRLLLRDMAPVLSFTAEEILSHLPEGLRVPQATVFALPPLDDLDPFLLPDGVRDDWNVLLAVRGAVTRAIEPLRRDGVVGHALDTRVTLYVADELRQRLEGLDTDLRAVCIVSQLALQPLAAAPQGAYSDPEVSGLSIEVGKAQGAKCERCWIYSTELGRNAEHPALCPRCTAVVCAQDNSRS